MCQHNGQGKQLVRLQAGVAIQDPLITCPLLSRCSSASAHSLRNVGALVVRDDLDLIVGLIAGFSNSSGDDGRGYPELPWP